MSKVALTLLGPPELVADGSQWQLPEKAFALFAILATSKEYTANRNSIRSILWGDFEQEKAGANLRQLIARIRRIERDIATTLLLVNDENLTLCPTACSVDLISMIDRNSQTAIDEESLASLWKGEPLEGLDFNEGPLDDWVTSIRQRVREGFLERASNLLGSTPDRSLGTAHWTLALRMLEIDNTQELPYRVLMKIYAQQGERVLAVRTFEKCKRILRTELGVEPDQATLDVARSLRWPATTISLNESVVTAFDVHRHDSGYRGKGQPENFSSAPRLIILPPMGIITDPTVRQLAISLIEDVTVGLSRYRSIAVIAPYTGLALAVRDARSDDALKALDVDYVVATSIIPRHPELHITFRLTNALTGEVLWATEATFWVDGLNEIFGSVVSLIVTSLISSIETAELKLPSTATSPTAYRFVLEGRGLMRTNDLRNIRRARSRFKEAAAKSTAYAAAYVGWSRSVSLEWLVRGMADNSLLGDASKLADKAIALDPLDGRALREKGVCCLYLREFDGSLSAFAEAQHLNPNDAETLLSYSDTLAHSGEPTSALAMCQKAMVLNPLPPDHYLWTLASIYYQLGEYEKSFATLKPTANNPATARLLAASAAKAGDLASAHRFCRIVRAVYPDFRVDDVRAIVPNKRSTDTEHLIDGLRLAGLS